MTKTQFYLKLKHSMWQQRSVSRICWMISCTDIARVQFRIVFSFDNNSNTCSWTFLSNKRKIGERAKLGKRFPYMETFDMISMHTLLLHVWSQVCSECQCSLTIVCFFRHISFVHAMYTPCMEVPRQDLLERVCVPASCLSLKDVNFSFKKVALEHSMNETSPEAFSLTGAMC